MVNLNYVILVKAIAQKVILAKDYILEIKFAALMMLQVEKIFLYFKNVLKQIQTILLFIFSTT